VAYADESVDGVRSIFLCRVLVGQYCEGKKDAKVPDVIDPSTHRLFDSTVNYVANPEIFVTYHDAQVYPDCKGLLTLTCNLHQIYSASYMRHQPLQCTVWLIRLDFPAVALTALADLIKFRTG